MRPRNEPKAVPTQSEPRVTERMVDAPSGAVTDRATAIGERYRVDAPLGRGGMGEVVLAYDYLLDRPVALKRPKTSSDSPFAAADGVALLREARAQARIDHPAFVPVHDYGLDTDGRPFFAMARVEGDTFSELLRRARDESDSRRMQAKLLRAFAQVCLAVDRAHSVGVVHGDLKPENLMLGRHGEVYVLDLGISTKVGVEIPDASFDAPPSNDESRIESVGGTLGYAAREQFRPSVPDTRWDVYALGAILFEILTLERLHRDVDRNGDATTWYARVETSPRARRPDLEIAPELDLECVRATMLDPSARTGSVRTLALAVEAYLDGERNHAHRRSIADDFVDQAVAMHARATEASDPSVSLDSWKSAVALLAQALVLAPTHARASATLNDLMLEPPRQLDEAVDAGVESRMQAHLRAGLSAATWAYAAWTICVPLILAAGLRDPSQFAALIVSGAATVGWCAIASRRRTMRPRDVIVAIVLSTITLFLGHGWFGPFGITSVALVANGVLFGMLPTRTMRCASLAATIVGLLASGFVGLSQNGGSFVIAGDSLVVHARLAHFPAAYTAVVLTILPIIVAISGFAVISTARHSLVSKTRSDYRERLHLAALASAVDDRSNPG